MGQSLLKQDSIQATRLDTKPVLVSPSGRFTECQYDAWAPWSKCSHTCGGGLTTRSRTAKYSHDVCRDVSAARECNTQYCESGDPGPEGCAYGPWSEWTVCSKICGGGQATRVRFAEGDPQRCADTKMTQNCGTAPCRPLDDVPPAHHSVLLVNNRGDDCP